eukprot:TRINITY_DN34016_c0_g1_i1.p1 TRINITY_DN34016_c0_g1~~TRINITY_DN34016_c0_g1_i1.p1  ORF type:complete len:972 (+),score=250.80 TRINITY_DN34016_c0_g1_i1:46-2916(+)
MDYVGRPLTCKVVPLFGECDCFATLPEQAVEGLRNEMRIRGPGVVVIEIEHGDKVDYVSWGQQVQERTEGGNCVGIPSLMMKELNLEKDTMVGIRYFIKIQQAKEVHVIPATVDDSEVIEHNQTRLEDLILRQLRVAYEGQVVPIFVRQGLHVRIKVTKITAPQVYPTKVPVVTLGDGTELIVETKMRDKPAASDAKNPPQPATLRVVSTTPTDGIPVLRITKETLEKFHWVEGSLMPCVPHTGIAAVAWGGAKTDKKVSASGVRRHTFNIIVKLHENGDLAVNEASVSCNIPTGSLVLVDPSLESSGTHTELAARTTVANVAGDVSVVQTEAWQDLKRALSFQTPSSGVHSVYSDAHAARSLGGLARSTLIVGGSGSGKTTVLEAVKEHASIYTVHFAKEDPDTADDQKQEKAAETDKVLKRLEKSFLEAAVNAPSLLLIDDLDQLVGEAPEQGRDLNLEMLADTVCELMLKHDQSPAVSHMAGVLPRAASSGVTVIATATNTDKVNPKISPMFSFSVKLPLPNGSEREAIARKTLQTEGFKPHKGVLSHLARETNNYTPRDVAGLSSKAAHQARISSTEKTVLWEHYEAAMSDFTPASLSGINMYKPSDLSWADVGGLDDIKKIFNETVILPTKYPELYANLPIKMRSGVLLYGPTGCGKSHVISCAVAEAGLNCIQVSGPELLNKYIGQSEQRVREVFEQAQAAAPCILFFDEFDSIAPQRGHDNTGVTDRVVNQLLCHLDGAEGRSGVYVVAATARPDLIDKALLRPGRLDVSAYCGMPGLAEREAVLCAAGRKLKIADGVSMATLAEQTQGYTSADLAAVLSTARLQCIQEIVDTSAALANMNVDDIVTKEAKESANEAWVSLHAAPADRDGLDSYISDLGLTSATATTLLPEAKLPIITGPILSSALGTTKASISKQDVERNTNLYKKFQASRSSSTRDEKPKGQRTTMA